MKKTLKIAGVLLAFAMLLGMAGCATKQTTSDGAKVTAVKTAGKLIVGTSADFPPYEFHDLTNGDAIEGSDVSLARAICADLGVELVFTDMDFNGLIPALQAGQVDIIISGMNASADRRETVDFSDEYYYPEQCVLVRTEDKELYKSAADFKGKTIGAQTGSTQEDFANEQIVSEGAELFSIANVQNLVMELKSGRIDGLVLDYPVADAFNQQHDDLQISDCPVQGDDTGFGVAVAKGNEDLVEAINATIKRLKDSGEMDKMLKDATELHLKQIVE